MTTNDDSNYWRSNDRTHKRKTMAYTFHRDLSLTPDLDIISAVGLCVHDGCTARTYAMTEQGLTAWALTHWEDVHTTGEGGKGRPSSTPSIKWLDIGDTEASLGLERTVRIAKRYKQRGESPTKRHLRETYGLTEDHASKARQIISGKPTKQQQTLIDILKQAGRPMTVKELATASGIKDAKSRLAQAAQVELVRRTSYGVYDIIE